MASNSIKTNLALQVELGTVNATLYTVDSTEKLLISDINISNTNASNVNVTLYLVASGDTAGVKNTLIPGSVIYGNDAIQRTGLITLSPGSTIQGFASSTGVGLQVSGGLET